MKFIAEKRSNLFVFGINIPVPKAGNIEERYLNISCAMESMNPDEREIFDSMRADFSAEQKAKDNEIAKKAAAEEAANEERQARLKLMSKEKADMLRTLDFTLPLD